MEDKISVRKQESMPTYLDQDKDTFSSSYLSAATHPSVRSRNKDDLFKRIRSGNDVLCRLPSRLDPNIQFSDDEEDEPHTEEDKEENKLPELETTPEFRPKSHELPCNRLFQSLTSSNRGKHFTPGLKPFNRQHFSASKRTSSVNNNYSDLKKLLPRSENKVRKTNAATEVAAKSRMSLMSQPEFKVPINKPLSVGIPPKKVCALTDEIIEVNNKPYNILSLLGSGGSCKVYEVFDSEKKSLVAIKCVDLKNTDPLIKEGYKKEIGYLQKLQGSDRVIKMFDYEYRQNELFIILERGDIDFAKYISNEAKLKRLNPLMIKFYWAQMLEAVADIHKYGIVHSDLKPANFLLVAGNLKLIDFGIATSVPDDKTSTFRDTQVGTLNYMSPEAITQLSTSDSEQIRFKIGVKSDVWSLGCILYNLVYGVTPFHSVKTLMQKIHAITSPKYEIEFKQLLDKLLLDVLKNSLKRDPKERASVDELLKHPYLTENKAAATSTETTKTNDLTNIMAQMQVLTPRRISYVTNIVKELSEKLN